MPRKKYSGYGSKEMHMDHGLSYAGAPQGYYSSAGKPMGSYGKPPNGFINHAGMPNAAQMKKRMDYMSNYYGSQSAKGGSMYSGGSTNAGTSPSVSSMDSTYKGSKKGRKKYA